MGAYLYILLCADGSYYVGITRDTLEKRIAEHEAGTFGGYTARRRPVKLVFHQHFDRIEDAIEDIRNGKMVIVVDDEDRENEGDFIIAAQHTTPEVINFMSKEARGLICLPLSRARVEHLGLSLMADAATTKVYSEGSTRAMLTRVLAAGITLGSLPLCYVESNVVNRPATALVFAQKPA